jgi:hypothetical protein
MKADPRSHQARDAVEDFGRGGEGSGLAQVRQNSGQGRALAVSDMAKHAGQFRAAHHQCGGFPIEKPGVPRLLDEDVNVGPEGLQTGAVGADRVGQGVKHHVDLDPVGLGESGDDLGAALEVVVEMARADPQGRRDIDGGQGGDALFVEEFQGLVENAGLRAQR